MVKKKDAVKEPQNENQPDSEPVPKLEVKKETKALTSPANALLGL